MVPCRLCWFRTTEFPHPELDPGGYLVSLGEIITPKYTSYLCKLLSHLLFKADYSSLLLQVKKLKWRERHCPKLLDSNTSSNTALLQHRAHSARTPRLQRSVTTHIQTGYLFDQFSVNPFQETEGNWVPPVILLRILLHLCDFPLLGQWAWRIMSRHSGLLQLKNHIFP